MNIQEAKIEYDKAKDEWKRTCVIHIEALKKLRAAKALYLKIKGPLRNRPRPRQEAMARGEKTYQGLLPCNRCGVVGLRFVQGKNCVACAKYRKRDYVAKKREEKAISEAERIARLTDNSALAKAWR